MIGTDERNGRHYEYTKTKYRKIMKKTINVAIGGCAFTLEEDAYKIMNGFLEGFESALDESSVSDKVMDELEDRIADLLKQKMRGCEVATAAMVQEIIDQIGYPEGYTPKAKETEQGYAPKKFFRDTDDRKIAGVCSGLALYFGVDVVIIRVLFLIALFCASAGFWAYVAVWVVAPEARTAEEKCTLRGLPPTPENLKKFNKSK